VEKVASKAIWLDLLIMMISFGENNPAVPSVYQKGYAIQN